MTLFCIIIGVSYILIIYLLINKIYLEKFTNNKSKPNPYQKIQKIPKIILQTYHTDKLNKFIQDHIDSFLAINTDYEYYLITDDIGIQLIKENFDENVLNAFLKLNTGAAKGDFLRYIAIYVIGGIYIDLDSGIYGKLDTIVDHNMDHYFFWDHDINIMNTPIISKPKNPIMLKIINEVVKRIHSGETNIFIATGPTVVTDVILNELQGSSVYNSKRNTSIIERKKVWETNYNFQNGFILNISKISNVIAFKMKNYKDEYLYDGKIKKYIPTFDSPTHNLYKT